MDDLRGGPVINIIRKLLLCFQEYLFFLLQYLPDVIKGKPLHIILHIVSMDGMAHVFKKLTVCFLSSYAQH